MEFPAGQAFSLLQKPLNITVHRFFEETTTAMA
jgi:hypothetical protein